MSIIDMMKKNALRYSPSVVIRLTRIRKVPTKALEGMAKVPGVRLKTGQDNEIPPHLIPGISIWYLL